MRFRYAIITLLIGLVLLGLGIAQLTAQNDDTLTAQTQGTQDAPFTVVSEDVIDAEADREEFTIEAEGEFTLAVGRDYDIEAWVDDAAHNRMTAFVEAEDDDPAHIEAEYVEGESTGPDPTDSDLWVATEQAEGDLLYRWSAPDESGEWALLIFHDGEEAAPASITVEYPDPQSQLPGVLLVIGGALVALLSVLLFYRASSSLKSRTETQKEDMNPDDDLNSDDAADTAETDQAGADQGGTDTDQTQRSDFTAKGRSWLSAGMATLVGAASAVGLAGPAHADDEATPDPEEDVEVEEEIPAEGYSVLLGSQLERILEDISQVVESGDEEQDAELLHQRVAGDALDVRETAYRNAQSAEAELPPPVGTEVLSAAVSGQEDFPRQAVVITEHPDTEAPQILVLKQASARENYRLVQTALMAPGTEFPSISAEQGGTQPLDPDSETGDFVPADTISAVGEHFTDADHEFGDSMAESVYMDGLHQYYQDLTEAADDTEISFPGHDRREEVTALQLPDGSVVVAGSFEVVMQMAPLEDGDTIFLEHDLVQEMVGTDWTTFPTEITSLESVVLHLPAPDSDEEVVLLGAHDIILDASIDSPEWFDGYDDE